MRQVAPVADDWRRDADRRPGTNAKVFVTGGEGLDPAIDFLGQADLGFIVEAHRTRRQRMELTEDVRSVQLPTSGLFGRELHVRGREKIRFDALPASNFMMKNGGSRATPGWLARTAGTGTAVPVKAVWRRAWRSTSRFLVGSRPAGATSGPHFGYLFVDERGPVGDAG